LRMLLLRLTRLG